VIRRHPFAPGRARTRVAAGGRKPCPDGAELALLGFGRPNGATGDANRRRGALSACEVAGLSYARRRRIRARTSEWVENKVANYRPARGAMEHRRGDRIDGHAGGEGCRCTPPARVLSCSARSTAGTCRRWGLVSISAQTWCCQRVIAVGLSVCRRPNAEGATPVPAVLNDLELWRRGAVG
jgi:hypothetical protein